MSTRKARLAVVSPGDGGDISGHSPDAPPLTGGDKSGHCPPATLQQVHAAYRKWFGKDYDLDALDCVLSAAASERLGGDPPWLLVVGGSGAAKTETIIPVVKAKGAVSVSTINGEAALLSGTSKRDRAKTATGGLLRQMGPSGLLVIKDVTSILSMNRDTRALVLAALREVYDGHWTRNVGTDGGQTLDWRGRIVVIGGVTTAWDAAHQVIATMGDRFLLVRLATGDTEKRRAAALQAMDNVDQEQAMRVELGAVVAGLLDNLPVTEIEVTKEERDAMVSAADLVTRARTAVERDFNGDPLFAHALEMPTRFAKQLVQIVRGGLAIGMDRGDAVRRAHRCAADSLPPMRLRVLLHVKDNPAQTTADVVRGLQLPRKTLDRALKELQLLDLLDVTEVADPEGGGKKRWIYGLSTAVDKDTVAALAMARNVTTPEKDTP